MTDKKAEKPRKTGAKRLRDKKARGKKDLRGAINVLALIEALEQHILGEKEMNATQVNAALALLKKTLPDIADPARKDKKSVSLHEDALKELE